ncbi:hypothetical protein DXG01_013673 [Tephrocybe rancida]|nr:hypothetical protein DXG01_013673 [Tephrocybe rancida]
MAIFAGGLVQFMAGMWEFPRGNVFGATGEWGALESWVDCSVVRCPMIAFSMYGAFWMSYATIFIPGSGVLASYDNAPDELANALGLYLTVWFMVTVMFIFPVSRRHRAFTVLLSVLALALLMLAIAQFTGSEQYVARALLVVLD